MVKTFNSIEIGDAVIGDGSVLAGNGRRYCYIVTDMAIQQRFGKEDCVFSVDVYVMSMYDIVALIHSAHANGDDTMLMLKAKLESQSPIESTKRWYNQLF